VSNIRTGFQYTVEDPNLIVVGASARAACFSAARAGFAPWWIDQFGDTDLRAAFPGTRVPADGYPDAVPVLLEAAPAAPVMVTGAMENHLQVLEQIAERRQLLGNGPDICRPLRDPFSLRKCLARHGIACPALAPPDDVSAAGGRWLAKPRRSGGGLGIRLHDPAVDLVDDFYLQQFVQGGSRSAVYVGDGERALLLGVTEQLVGRAEFHAGEFSYCGSLGPLSLDANEWAAWERIGTALVESLHVRGLFGVDAVCVDGAIVPVEVNPRYTASVEVIERATGAALVSLHVKACHGELTEHSIPQAQCFAGKAYLFAPGDLDAPDPDALCRDVAEFDDLELADLPAAVEPIRKGAPVLTLLVRAEDEEACARLLSRAAQRIYAALS